MGDDAELQGLNEPEPTEEPAETPEVPEEEPEVDEEVEPDPEPEDEVDEDEESAEVEYEAPDAATKELPEGDTPVELRQPLRSPSHAELNPGW